MLFIYHVKLFYLDTKEKKRNLERTSVHLKQKSKTLGKYLIKFNHPAQKKPSKMWFSVADMTDYFRNKLDARSYADINKKSYRHLLIPITKCERLESITTQGYTGT